MQVNRCDYVYIGLSVFNSVFPPAMYLVPFRQPIIALLVSVIGDEQMVNEACMNS